MKSVILKLKGIKENYYRVLEDGVVTTKTYSYVRTSPSGKYFLLADDGKHKNVYVSKEVIKYVSFGTGELSKILDNCYPIKYPENIVQDTYYIDVTKAAIYKLNITNGISQCCSSSVVKRFSLKVTDSPRSKRFNYDELLRMNTPKYINDLLDNGYKYLDMIFVNPHRYLINSEGIIYDTVSNIYLKESNKKSQYAIKFENGKYMMVNKEYLINKMFNNK